MPTSKDPSSASSYRIAREAAQRKQALIQEQKGTRQQHAENLRQLEIEFRKKQQNIRQTMTDEAAAAAQIDQLQKQYDSQRRVELQKQLQERKRGEEQIHTKATLCAQKQISTMTLANRKLAYEELAREESAHQQKLRDYDTELKVALQFVATEEEKSLITRERARLESQIAESSARSARYSADKEKIEKFQLKEQLTTIDGINERIAAVKKLQSEEETKIAEQIQLVKFEIENTEDEQAKEGLAKHLNNLQAQLAETTRSFEEQTHALEDLKNNPKVLKKARQEVQEKNAAERKKKRDEVKEKAKTFDLKDSAAEAFENSVKQLDASIKRGLDEIDNIMTDVFSYQSSIEARLQGSDESYKEILDVVDKRVGLSAVVSQKEVLTNIRELVDSGVAYNLELRGYLATVSKDIATTFNALEPTLLRLIRIQQADTTGARLGLEASLTKLFNEYFSDTSYLSKAFDSVSQAIFDASAQLSRDQSLAFEYQTQKWLGALYSLGLSETAINTIATGINYLGTGNVQTLQSNQPLMNLFAMSAAESGISLADILTGGLDSETTNDLLRGMIEYLQTITDPKAENNQVTRAAYADVFGIGVADLLAIGNMTTKEIEQLYKEDLTYKDATKELDKQLNTIVSRVHLSQMGDRLVNNMLMGVATEIGSSLIQYVPWKVSTLLKDISGGISIPTLMAAGTGIDVETSVADLLREVQAGANLLVDIFGAAFGRNELDDLKGWGFSEYRGQGKKLSRIEKDAVEGSSYNSKFDIIDFTGKLLSGIAPIVSDMFGPGLGTSTKITEEAGELAGKLVKGLSGNIDSNQPLSPVTGASGTVNNKMYEQIYSANYKDMYYATLQDKVDSALETNQIINTTDQSASIQQTSDEKLYDAIAGSSSSLLSETRNMVDLLSADRMFKVQLEDMDRLMSTIATSKNDSLTEIDKSVNVDTIHELSSVVSATAATTSSKIVTVSIAQLAPEVQEALVNTISAKVSSSLTNSDDSTSATNTAMLAEALRIALTNIDVKVTNDFFDESLRRIAFSM